MFLFPPSALPTRQGRRSRVLPLRFQGGIARYRQQPDGAARVQRLLDRYRRRMYDISVFIKELKGRFAQWYNQRHDRYGVLWAERFKSVLLEGGEALAAGVR